MALENLLNYTENDVAANRVVLTDRKATVTDIDRDESVQVYRDFGAGYIDGLNFDFDFNFTGTDHGTTPQCLLATITGGTITGGSSLASTDISVHAFRTAGGVYELYLGRGDLVAFDAATSLSADTVYYCTMSRAAGNDTVTLTLYSDAARTTTVDTLTVTGFSTTTWRYHYAICGYNDGGTARHLDFVAQNFNFNIAEAKGAPIFFP